MLFTRIIFNVLIYPITTIWDDENISNAIRYEKKLYLDSSIYKYLFIGMESSLDITLPYLFSVAINAFLAGLLEHTSPSFSLLCTVLHEMHTFSKLVKTWRNIGLACHILLFCLFTLLLTFRGRSIFFYNMDVSSSIISTYCS